MLEINQDQIKQIIAHAQKIYPEECCGIILGTKIGNHKKVTKIWETENSWPSENTEVLDTSLDTKRSRFSIPAEMLLKAQKTAREEEIVVIGFYHSHPDTAAIPSETDRILAHQIYSYVIVSLSKGIGQDLRSWVLNLDNQFDSEPIVNI